MENHMFSKLDEYKDKALGLVGITVSKKNTDIDKKNSKVVGAEIARLSAISKKDIDTLRVLHTEKEALTDTIKRLFRNLRENNLSAWSGMEDLSLYSDKDIPILDTVDSQLITSTELAIMSSESMTEVNMSLEEFNSMM